MNASKMLDKLVLRMMKKGIRVPSKNYIEADILFSEEEVKGLEPKFRAELERVGRVAWVRKYVNGYEIFYDRNGYYKSVFDSDLKKAKQLFLTK